MRWISFGLFVAAVLGALGALVFGTARAGFLVGGAAVLCAAGGAVMWFIVVIRTAAENAANKENFEARRRDERP